MRSIRTALACRCSLPSPERHRSCWVAHFSRPLAFPPSGLPCCARRSCNALGQEEATKAGFSVEPMSGETLAQLVCKMMLTSPDIVQKAKLATRDASGPF